MSGSGPWAEVRFAIKPNTRGASPPDVRQRRTRTSPRIQSAPARGARGYDDVFGFLFARLPLCERPDIGNFAALVRPGIDRPEFVGLAILDHGRVVRTLGEYEPRHRRSNRMVPQQFELVENEQARIRVGARIDAFVLVAIAHYAD